MIRRALNTALRRASTALIGFGIVLVLVGAGVQAMRALSLRSVEERAPAPSFDASLRAAEPRSGPPLGAAPALATTPAAAPTLANASAAAQGSVAIDPIQAPASPDATAIARGGVGYLPLAVLRRSRYRFGTPTAAASAASTPPAASGSDRGAIPERIIIPSLNLDRRVVEIGWDVEIVDNDTLRSVWQTARHAAGFHRGSAPVGVPGNTVISGHNNIDGAVFGELHRLQPGDRVVIEAGGELKTYAVEMNFVVQEEGVSPEQRLENARWIGRTPDERLTLVTCYPPWGNTHRTIVVARPADDGPDGLRREGLR